MNIEDYKKLYEYLSDTISNWKLTQILGLMLPTYLSGMLIILIFSPELFEKLDVIKLTILSLTFTLPVFCLNMFITATLGSFMNSIGNKVNRNKHLFFWISIWTTLFFYYIIINSYSLKLTIMDLNLFELLIIDLAIGIVILMIMRSIIKYNTK